MTLVRQRPAILGLMILFLIAIVANLMGLFPSTLPVFAPACRQDYLLIVDPGHGGEDGGAVSVSGVAESGINLAISLKCKDLAGLYGIPIQLLREEDRSLALAEAQTLREKKRSDLDQRASLINETDNALLLSIHQNFFDQPEYSGAQVFFRPEQESYLWGCLTQDLLRRCLDSDNRRLPKEVPDDLYLMSNTSCPAILVECGFLSIPEEDRLLQTDDYQTRLAVVLIGSYLSKWY